MSAAKQSAAKQNASPLDVIMTWAEGQPTQAAIADGIGVSGKTVRGRSRAGTLDAGEGADALPPVRVSKEGQTALTVAHKRAIVRTFAPKDDTALAALADKLGS
jgi:hypothetical protein